MAMEKRMSSESSVSVIANSHSFEEGTRFMRDGYIFTVTEAFEQQGTQLRRIMSNVGEESFQSVSSLRKDAANNNTNFAFLQDDEPEGNIAEDVAPAESE